MSSCPRKQPVRARSLSSTTINRTPDTINATIKYPGKMLTFEMRIWNPYGMEGRAENGVAVYGGDGMVQIAK